MFHPIDRLEQLGIVFYHNLHLTSVTQRDIRPERETGRKKKKHLYPPLEVVG